MTNLSKGTPVRYRHIGILICVILLTAILYGAFIFWFFPDSPTTPPSDTIKEQLIAPFDTIWLGASLSEVKANCESQGGTFSSALFNNEDFEFHAICLWRDQYYKVYIPENERPKHPCMIEPVRDPACDN